MITSEEVNINPNEEIDYKDLYIRTLADYKNLQRRSLEEKRDIARRASYDMLLKILPLYHDAKKGMIYKEKGATLLYNKFKQFLIDNHIDIINSAFFKNKTNNKFSEEYAIAVSIKHPNEDEIYDEISPEIDNTIAHVIEDGFIDTTTNKIISYAKVIVYKVN